MIHSFYIFYRKDCIFKLHFTESWRIAIAKTSNSEKLMSESDYEVFSTKMYTGLMCGFLTGLDHFSAAISNNEATEGVSISYYNTCSTPTYKIHYVKTLSDYKLVCFTSPEVESLCHILEYIYTNIIATKLMLNPDYKLGSEIDDLRISVLIEKALVG